MLRLHLVSFCCLSAIATSHTLECQHNPNANLWNWTTAIAYAILSLLQLLVLVHLHRRTGRHDAHDIPPIA